MAVHFSKPWSLFAFLEAPSTMTFFSLTTLVTILSLELFPNLHQTLALAGHHIDPTEGFIPVLLNESNFVIQWPYDVPEDQRYSFINGVHKLWVYSSDKPHTPISKTKPRTEIRIKVFSSTKRERKRENKSLLCNLIKIRLSMH